MKLAKSLEVSVLQYCPYNVKHKERWKDNKIKQLIKKRN